MTHNVVDLETKYSRMVKMLLKPGHQIINELTPEKAELKHMGMLIAEEGGEVCGVIKKHVIGNKELNREKLIEEMGDVEYALDAIRQLTGISRDECLEFNMNKLLTGERARYKQGKFSNEQMNNRIDQT